MNDGLSACSLEDLKNLCTAAGWILTNDEEEPQEVSPPCCVVGDLNGDVVALKTIISHYCEQETRMVFLGNYIGKHNENSLECLCLILAMKTNSKKKFMILRGPNETEEVAMDFGFHIQLMQRYGVQEGVALFKKLVSLFELLPATAIVNEKVFCAHGAVSRFLPRKEEFSTIHRPIKLEEDVMVADLVTSEPWNDLDFFARHPDKDVLVFGPKHVEATNQNLNCELVIRGATDQLHQGFAVFAQGQMVLIGSTFQTGSVAVVHIDEDGWRLRIMEKAGEGKARLLHSGLFKIGTRCNSSYDLKIEEDG